MNTPMNPFPQMVGLAGRIRLVASRLAAASANDVAVQLGDIAADVARLEAANVDMAKQIAAHTIAKHVADVLPWQRPSPLGRRPANSFDLPPRAA